MAIPDEQDKKSLGQMDLDDLESLIRKSTFADVTSKALEILVLIKICQKLDNISSAIDNICNIIDDRL